MSVLIAERRSTHYMMPESTLHGAPGTIYTYVGYKWTRACKYDYYMRMHIVNVINIHNVKKLYIELDISIDTNNLSYIINAFDFPVVIGRSSNMIK